MSETTKETLLAIWDKLSIGGLKAFRGLICEKKEGGWELSKGNVAFWVVLSHSMYVWNGARHAAAKVVNVAMSANEGITDAAPAAIAAVAEAANTVSYNTGVPEQEFYLLMALLGYSAIKTTKGGLTNALSALRGNSEKV